ADSTGKTAVFRKTVVSNETKGRTTAVGCAYRKKERAEGVEGDEDARNGQMSVGHSKLYIAYQDTEWRVPVHDDQLVFEYLASAVIDVREIGEGPNRGGGG